VSIVCIIIRAIKNESKSVTDILSEMQDDEEYGVAELIHLLGPIKDIAEKVEL